MTEVTPVALRRLSPFLAAAALLVCFGLSVEYFGGFARFRHYVGTETAPQTLARLGRSGKSLVLLDYNTPAGTRLKGYEQTILPTDMPSTTIIDPEIVKTGLPIVSLVVDPEDLMDRDLGIYVNYNKRGRSWERPGYATFFRDAEIQFATGAGVRVHGGRSRAALNKSFQLRFRKIYGEGSAPLALIDDEMNDKVNSLVIHNSLSSVQRPHFHYVNPVAYEIAKRIGCIVPAWTPVQFYLNGDYQGAYVLTERINEDFFKTHYGHKDFVIFDTRASNLNRGSRKDIVELLSLSKPENVSASMAEMNEKVDLENLTNWHLSVLYGGTTDAFQGYAARDKTREDSRWFWVNWDMDHSFIDLYSQVEHPWEIDILGRLIGRNTDARVVIFKKLITTSPGYREYFFSRFAETLNHDLNQQYMEGLIERYRETATSMGFERTYLLENLGDFARYRPAVLRNQVTQHLSAGPSHSLTVKSRPGVPLKIDGRSVGEAYEGWYFEMTTARLEFDDDADVQKFTWVVNGKPVASADRVLTLDLKSNTTVEIVPAV